MGVVRSNRSSGDVGSESTNLPMISEYNLENSKIRKFSKSELFVKQCESTNASIIEMSKKAVSPKKYFFDAKASINK